MGEITLIDGGYASQIKTHLNEEVDGHPLWAARFIVTNRNVILATHRDFIRAGSKIIRTDTYQGSVQGFVKYMNLTEAEAKQVIKDSVSLVREAILLENKKGKVEIAGSVGSYGAFLHDGSEYTGAFAEKISTIELVKWHRPRVETLIEAGCKLLAFETIPASKEALALISLLKEFPGVSAWISFSIRDEKHISNGELFSEVIAKCWDEGRDCLIALGCNCVQPSLVSQLLASARQTSPDVPFIVYPNSGETYNKQLERWEEVGKIRPVVSFVPEWLDLGVKYVGMCCRTTVNDLTDALIKIEEWSAKSTT